MSKLLWLFLIAMALGSNGVLAAPGAISQSVTVCQSIDVTPSTAYGINFVAGSVLNFQKALQPQTGSGILENVVVTVKDNETTGMTLFIFNSPPSAASVLKDNTLAAIAGADVPLLRGVIPLGINTQLGATGFTTYYANGLGIGVAPGPGNTSVYGVLVLSGTLSTNFAASGDVQACATFLQDQ